MPSRVRDHATFTFWYVLPTPPMFRATPWLLQRLGFVAALRVGAVIASVCDLVMAAVLKR
jgi:hypothetical protein